MGTTACKNSTNVRASCFDAKKKSRPSGLAYTPTYKHVYRHVHMRSCMYVVCGGICQDLDFDSLLMCSVLDHELLKIEECLLVCHLCVIVQYQHMHSLVPSVTMHRQAGRQTDTHAHLLADLGDSIPIVVCFTTMTIVTHLVVHNVLHNKHLLQQCARKDLNPQQTHACMS